MVKYVPDQSVGGVVCGSSASAQNETAAALLPASPSRLGSRGFGKHGPLTDADVLVEPPRPLGRH